MREINERQYADSPGTVLHWYDFICPFCYIGQQRNAILVQYGLHVVELAFQAHTEIPSGGIPAGPRNGPMYAMLEHEAREAELPLRWPKRLPNTRLALAAAEWIRRHHESAFPQLHKALFAAHFVLGEDLEDPGVIDRHAGAAGIDIADLHAALADGSAAGALEDADRLGRKYGVQGTPAWLFAQGMITGLRGVAEFERLAQDAVRLSQRSGPLSRKLS